MAKNEIDTIIRMCSERMPDGLECRSGGEAGIRSNCDGLEGCMLELEAIVA